MEALLSVLIGLGLAAACGFRVFIPLLVLGLAYRTGNADLGEGFAWIGSAGALWAFGAATVLEIAGYYVPWVDNLLDAVATPSAIVAGVVVTASSLGADVSPLLKWTLAVIGGGGTAASVQGLTTVARQVSSFATGGLGNPVLSTLEAGGSALLSVLAITLPLLAILVVVLILYFGARRFLFRPPAARAT